jgi:hypothetical protein
MAKRRGENGALKSPGAAALWVALLSLILAVTTVVTDVAVQIFFVSQLSLHPVWERTVGLVLDCSLLAFVISVMVAVTALLFQRRARSEKPRV